MRIVSIVGRKNAGKTTLLVALGRELRRRGHRVMTIKHAHHPLLVDTEGTDSYRHFHEIEAERTIIAGPEVRVVLEHRLDDNDPVGLAQRYLEDADIVLAEGFSRAPLPKIEVHRRVASKTPLFDADAANTKEWIALVTDDADLRASCLVLRFQDTMWLHLLASVAWEQALKVN